MNNKILVTVYIYFFIYLCRITNCATMKIHWDNSVSWECQPQFLHEKAKFDSSQMIGQVPPFLIYDLWKALKKKENDAERRGNWRKIAHNASKRIDNEVLEGAKNSRQDPTPRLSPHRRELEARLNFIVRYFFTTSLV